MPKKKFVSHLTESDFIIFSTKKSRRRKKHADPILESGHVAWSGLTPCHSKKKENLIKILKNSIFDRKNIK